MKFLGVLCVISYCLWGCAPDSTTGVKSRASENTKVDESTYRTLIDTSWCQPIQERNPFRISWVFRKDDAAYWIKTNLNTKKSESVKKRWQLNDKTLSILDPVTGAETIKVDVRFKLDIATATNLMLWSTADDSSNNCKDGLCSSKPAEVMILTNCNPEE